MKIDRNIFDKIKITDNILFTSVFMNADITKQFLKDVIKLNVTEIIKIEKEKVIDNIGNSRGVRLDVYVEDSDKIYNIEMQVENKEKNLPERLRYYQGALDVHHLHKGDEFTNLKTTYIIFICPFNPFKDLGVNDVIYDISSQFISSNGKTYDIKDRSHKIVINTLGDVSTIQDNTIKSFVELINNGYQSENKSNLTNAIQQEISNLKNNDNWRRKYMNTMQEYIEEVRKETRNQERIYFAVEMLKDGVNDSTILKYSKLTPEQLEQIKKELSK